MTAELPPLPAADRALEEVRAGTVTGLSIRFRPVRERMENGIRIIEEAVLRGIAITRAPSYQDSRVEARSTEAPDMAVNTRLPGRLTPALPPWPPHGRVSAMSWAGPVPISPMRSSTASAALLLLRWKSSPRPHLRFSGTRPSSVSSAGSSRCRRGSPTKRSRLRTAAEVTLKYARGMSTASPLRASGASALLARHRRMGAGTISG